MRKRFISAILSATCIMLLAHTIRVVSADTVDLRCYYEEGQVKMRLQSLPVGAEDYRLIVFSDAEYKNDRIWVVTSVQGFKRDELKKRFVQGEAEGDNAFVITDAKKSKRNALQLFYREKSNDGKQRWVNCSPVCTATRGRDDKDVAFKISFAEEPVDPEQVSAEAGDESQYLLLLLPEETILATTEQSDEFYEGAEREEGVFVETAHEESMLRFSHVITETMLSEELEEETESSTELMTIDAESIEESLSTSSSAASPVIALSILSEAEKETGVSEEASNEKTVSEPEKKADESEAERAEINKDKKAAEGDKESQTESKETKPEKISVVTVQGISGSKENGQEESKASNREKKHIFKILNGMRPGGMLVLLVIIAGLLFAVTAIKRKL